MRLKKVSFDSCYNCKHSRAKKSDISGRYYPFCEKYGKILKNSNFNYSGVFAYLQNIVCEDGYEDNGKRYCKD